MARIDELKITDYEVLYDSGDVSLLCKDDDVILVTSNEDVYKLSSQPYEPCFYMKTADGNTIIIHNSFDVSEIVELARNNSTMRMITGNTYDIRGVCELLLIAIKNHVTDTTIDYLEKSLATEKTSQKEIEKVIEDDSSYTQIIPNSKMKELLDDPFYGEYKEYEDCVLDYCIVKSDERYNYEESHKEAVLFAMASWGKRLKEEYDMDIVCNPEKMKATKIEKDDLFESAKPYCELFLNPPHGSNYTIDDFIKINQILFPNGKDNLDIYEWTTDWSNYFEEGLEWWGAKCVSIYDKSLERFVIIGASATD